MSSSYYNLEWGQNADPLTIHITQGFANVYSMYVESTDLLCLQLFSYMPLSKGEYLSLPLEEVSQDESASVLAFKYISIAMAWTLRILFTTLKHITVRWLKLLIENDMLTKIAVNLKAPRYVDDHFVNTIMNI